MKSGQAGISVGSAGPAVAKEQPLDRALAVLDAVTRAPRPVSMTDIASQCGLPVPTAHRLVAQLEERGLLKRALDSKKLVVGPGLVRLGTAALEAALRTDLPHQILVAFANDIGEHCQIGLRSEDAIVYVDTVQATRSQGLHFEPGRRSPLYCTSIGKLYLAEMTDPEFDRWLTHTPLKALTPRTIVSPAKLKALVKNVRRQGWAASNEEVAAGVVGCAVPIRTREGKLLAGLGISVPSARLAFDQLAEYRVAMESVAAQMAAALSAED